MFGTSIYTLLMFNVPSAMLAVHVREKSVSIVTTTRSDAGSRSSIRGDSVGGAEVTVQV